MNDNLTGITLFHGTKMKASRRMKQGLADEATIRDAQAPMESLREEEEGKDR